MLTIYGINSCDSCRAAKKFLASKGMEFEFHDLRADGLDIQMLERWSDRLGWERLLNKRSLTWRKIPEVDRNDMNKDKALAAIIDRPTLMKRPILEAKQFIAVGFSEKRFTEFLANL